MSVTSPPQVRKTTSEIDFSQTEEWLAQYRREYVGKWVVLDGGRLIGFGDDPRPIVAQARAEGVSAPFVEQIQDDSEPYMGGWL
jgi:hypothetical protein